MAENRAAAEKAFDPFTTIYQREHLKLTESQVKNREGLLTFSIFTHEVVASDKNVDHLRSWRGSRVWLQS